MYLKHDQLLFLAGCTMHGLDEVELQFHTNIIPDVFNSADKMKAGFSSEDTLASYVTRGEIQNDYDPMWMIKTHCSSFPHGTGQCPKGMSAKEYYKALLQRYPRTQFAQNPALIIDAFNVVQRHEVNLQSHVQLGFGSNLKTSTLSLKEPELHAVLDCFGSYDASIKSQNSYKALNDAQRTVFKGLSCIGGRVIGSPQSFRSLRSKVLATHVVFGPYTTMFNLCPGEQFSEWTFALAGKEYKFDKYGKPEGRPETLECLKTVAQNPDACAHFIQAYLEAFCDIFLGWPMGSAKQVNPDCMFGVLLAAYLKYEASGRGGKHAHGQAIQAYLHFKNLENIMKNGQMASHLFTFMESVACSYFPSPEKPLGSQIIIDLHPFEAPTLEACPLQATSREVRSLEASTIEASSPDASSLGASTLEAGSSEDLTLEASTMDVMIPNPSCKLLLSNKIIQLFTTYCHLHLPTAYHLATYCIYWLHLLSQTATLATYLKMHTNQQLLALYIQL